MAGVVTLPDINELVVRTYEVGLQFRGENKKEQLSNRFFANEIVRKLQYKAYDLLTPDVVQRADLIVRDRPQLRGTRGTATIRKNLGKGYGSNLSQSSYLQLLAALKNQHQKEEKLKKFLKMLSNHPTELFEWLLFGRTPYIEKKLQYELYTTHKVASDMISSCRRKIDAVVPESLQLTTILAEPTHKDFKNFFSNILQKTRLDFQLDQAGKRLSTSTCTFKQFTYFNKLQLLCQHQQIIIPLIQDWIKEWNNPLPTTPRSRWKHLALFSRSIDRLVKDQLTPNRRYNQHAFRSVIRELLVAALRQYYQDGWTANQLVNDILDSKLIVSLPFIKQKKRYSKKLPIQLVMGYKYVIDREGTGEVLTQQAKTKGSFWIRIYPEGRKRLGVYADVLIHDKIKHFLENGATISSLVITTSTAPARKVQVQIIMDGRRWMFLSKTAIQEQILTFRKQNITLSEEIVRGLGLDINQLGDSMLAFSEPYLISKHLKKLIDRYNNLEQVLAEVGRQLTRKHLRYRHHPSVSSQKKWLKQQSELERIHDRRDRLLKTVHQQAQLTTAAVLIHSEVDLFSVEDLRLSAKHTRGALAKAILSLPDEPELTAIATMTANWISGRFLHLERVHPHYTSQALHLDCPSDPVGRIQRVSNNSALGKCSNCQLTLPIHIHAARVIRNRGHDQFSSRPD